MKCERIIIAAMVCVTAIVCCRALRVRDKRYSGNDTV